MKISDLRDELAHRAAETDERDADLLPGVHHKITTTKRRRTGTAVVAALAVAAVAIGVTPRLVSTSAPDPAESPSVSPTMKGGMPSTIPPSDDRDFVKDDITYRYKIGGQTLQAAAISDRGERNLTLRWNVTSLDLGFAKMCDDPDATGAEPEQRPWVSLTLNGKPLTGGSCASIDRPDASPGSSYHFDPGYLTSIGVKPGAVATLRARFTAPPKTDGNRHLTVQPGPRAQLGLAVYHRGERRLIGGVDLPVVTEWHGHDYQLSTHRTAPADTASRVTIDTPAGIPFLVAAGSSNLGAVAITAHLVGIDDRTGMFGETGGVGLGFAEQPSRPAGKASLVISGDKPKRGELVIAVYTPTN